MKKYLSIFYRSIINLIDHYGIEMAGYLAFLSILSIFPFLVFIIAIFGLIRNQALGESLLNFITQNMSPDIAKTIELRIQEIISGPPKTILTLSLVGIVWSASSSFEGIRGVINMIYQVKSPPHYFIRRLTSILEFLIVSVAITLVSLASAVIPDIINYITDYLSSNPDHFQLLSKIIEFNQDYIEAYRQLTLNVLMLMTVIFMYCHIPSIRIKIKDALPGACITVFLWGLSGILLQEYISNFSQLNLVYGSIAGVIILLLFFYIIHIIWIFGAEFNFLLAEEKKRNL